MLSALLIGGFIAGVLATLLAIKLLPIKISFDWESSGAVKSIKGRFISLRSDYCKVCKTAPCQSTFGHRS